MDTVSEAEAMRRALAVAADPGVPLGPNPRVGCVIITPDGTVVAQGHHLGAGTPHAEAAALAAAGEAARGATAVVTLEPCNHTGRTGPCTQALIRAGVSRVVFAQSDPNPVAAGGAETLRAAGIDVVAGLLSEESARLNRAWTFGILHERPFVTWKYAATLDGRVAAADGSSRWITSSVSRGEVHRLRAECDVVLVGTGTVAIDDPALTVRDADGNPSAHQPLRAVLGERLTPVRTRVLDDAAPTVLLRTRDPRAALDELFALGRRHVFLEGGPTVAAAFLRAGLVDEVVAYLAPTLLGDGPAAVADLGIGAIADALTFDLADVAMVPATGTEPANVRLTLTPRQGAGHSRKDS